jgi:hypothetical protein
MNGINKPKRCKKITVDSKTGRRKMCRRRARTSNDFCYQHAQKQRKYVNKYTLSKQTTQNVKAFDDIQHDNHQKHQQCTVQCVEPNDDNHCKIPINNCCFCGDECSYSSQCCGRCARLPYYELQFLYGN